MAYSEHYHPCITDWETFVESLADLPKATE